MSFILQTATHTLSASRIPSYIGFQLKSKCWFIDLSIFIREWISNSPDSIESFVVTNDVAKNLQVKAHDTRNSCDPWEDSFDISDMMDLFSINPEHHTTDFIWSWTIKHIEVIINIIIPIIILLEVSHESIIVILIIIPTISVPTTWTIVFVKRKSIQDQFGRGQLGLIQW